MLGKILILKRKLAMSPLYTEKTFCIERVTLQLTFFFFLYCWSFEKLFVLEYSWLYSNNIYTLCYNNVVIVSGGQQRDSAIDMLLLFSRKFMSDSLWPRGLQHGRLICPSLSLRVCSNSNPSSWWCPQIISSSVSPFFPSPQPFWASGSFLKNWGFPTSGKIIGASILASVITISIYDWLNI